MRIVSGKLRGRRVIAPNYLPVRPTTDMAKEALFNILNNDYYFDEVSALDLFAGIGSISFEFCSRGCADVLAVDVHSGCIKFLEKTSEELGADLQVVKSDVFSFLNRNKKSYDLIFADPPYDLEPDKLQTLVALVFDRGMLLPDGKLIVEHGPKTNLSHLPKFEQSRKYGNNVFSFFTN